VPGIDRNIAPSSRRLTLVVVAALAAGCSHPRRPSEPVKLGKFAPQLPSPPPLPLAPAPPRQSGPKLGDVLDRGCSTKVVEGLSAQIIAEGNCLVPGAYVPLPERRNVTLGPAAYPYLREPARDALLGAVDQSNGRPLRVTSLLRTVAQQYLLNDWYQGKRCGIKLAAEPGQSRHEGGLAVDIRDPASWRRSLERQGFRWMGSRDRWHFEYVGEDADDGSAETESLDVKAFQRLHNRNHPDARIPEDGRFDAATERALRDAPADGFALGPVCAAAMAAQGTSAPAASPAGASAAPPAAASARSPANEPARPGG
jgi:hypothetical protein